MLRSLRTLRSIPRIKDIALILGKHGFHQVAEVLQAPFRTRLRRVFKQRERHRVDQPERLRLALEELGPTFIKFGQMLSTRPDLVPEEYVDELRLLQDQVKAAPFAEVRASLEEEFESPIEEHFRYVNSVPLAAASIAQVHRAVTLEGRQVVVKVRRRGIERIVRQDLQVLSLVAEFVAGLEGLRLFDPEGVIRTFESSLGRELDFGYEKNNLLRIRASIGEDEVITVPELYPDLCRPGVLTMEYLVGEKLSSLRGRPAGRQEGRRLATAISLCILRQVFEHGFYHADPHPGNFLLMPQGRVGLIDFGNVGKCTPEMVDHLLLLLLAVMQRNYLDIARWFLKRSGPQRNVDAETLALELMDTLDPFYGLEIGDVQIGGLFKSLFSTIVRHRLSVPAPYVHIGRTFIALEGVVRLASPDLELLPAIRPYMTDVLRRRWAPERILRELRGELTELFTAIRSYPGNLSEVLSRAASGQLHVVTSTPELAHIEERIEQASNRLPIAIMVSGLLVSSAILLFAQGASQSALQQILGLVGFGGGLLLTARLVLKS